MCMVGTVSGVCKSIVTGKRDRRIIPIYCGKWSCHTCRDRKAKRTLARALNGGIVLRGKQDGFRDKYNYKLLTLTAPGKEWREKHSKPEALALLQEGFQKVIKALRHSGKFDFLRVVEAQKDGFPHFHVLLAGPGIRRKEVLRDIVRLWGERYGFGFVKMNALKSGTSIEKAISYCLKYLFKEPMTLPKRKRLFTASQGALAPAEKKHTWEQAIFRMGTTVEYVVTKVLGFTARETDFTGDSWAIPYFETCPF